MAKQIIAVVAVAVLLVVGACAGILFWAQRSGATAQEKFFTAVMTGDPQQVLALCDPALKDEIDAPVLAAWQNEVKKQLGDFEGLSKTDFNTSARTTSEGSFVESQGTVNFARGTARSELSYRDGLLISFNIRSDKIPDDWFTGPTATAVYRQRGETFIRAVFAEELDKAHALMHESLQANLPVDKLRQAAAKIAGESGMLESVAVTNEMFRAEDRQTLTIVYAIECEKAATTAEIEFQFVGLKGHLTGFNIH